MRLSTTDSDIDVRFYYLAPDSKTYETSSNIRVASNASTGDLTMHRLNLSLTWKFGFKEKAYFISEKG